MGKKVNKKGPGLFSGIGKKTREIMYKDYNCGTKLGIINPHAKNGLDVDADAVRVKFNTLSDISVTFTGSDIMPDVRSIVSMKLPEINLEKIETQYFHDHAAISSTVSFMPRVTITDVSATIGTLGIVLGAEAGFHPVTGEYTKYNAGIGMTRPKFYASCILADKGDLLKASYVHYLDQLRATTAIEFANRFSENRSRVTVGGSYAVDDSTLTKLKLDNHGTFGAVLQHEVTPKLRVTMAAELNYKSLNTIPKVGLSLAMKL